MANPINEQQHQNSGQTVAQQLAQQPLRRHDHADTDCHNLADCVNIHLRGRGRLADHDGRRSRVWYQRQHLDCLQRQVVAELGRPAAASASAAAPACTAPVSK